MYSRSIDHQSLGLLLCPYSVFVPFAPFAPFAPALLVPKTERKRGDVRGLLI